MKRTFIIIWFGLFSMAGFAQETNAYTFFVNVVNDNFKFPLIGFVNMAKGDHKGIQLGFVNWNVRDFTGLQTGFVNTTGGNLIGAQFAFINTNIQKVQGAQIGFINSATQVVHGAQIGFMNTAIKELHDAQVGFVNTALNEVRGVQMGFVNTTIKASHGVQMGFVNSAIKASRGVQMGFVNVTRRKETGVQLGFFNYVDTLEKGVPIGFLSIIRRGGYLALETGFSEFFPVMVGFKTGVEKFYTTLYIAYRPFESSSKNRYATGVGFGSIIPLKKSFFFNPELHLFNPIEKKNNRQLSSIIPLFGYHFNRHFSITAGPSVVWSNCEADAVLLKPVFYLANFDINNKNAIFVGARAGLRYRF